MWVASGGSKISKKRQVASQSLDDMVSEKRAKLVHERQTAKDLQTKAASLRIDALKMDKRFKLRQRFETLSEAEDLEVEARTRLSRIREIDFERAVHAYTKYESTKKNTEQSRTDSVSNEKTARRIITVPGAGAQQTMGGFVQKYQHKECTRSTLVQEYLVDVEQKAPKLVVRGNDDCPYCDTNMLLQSAKSCLVCSECGYTALYLDSTTNAMSYSDEYEFNSFSYKRVSHFDDTLRQIQGKESYVVPDDIVNAVIRELVAQRIPKHQITQTKIRTILKQLRIRKAYDHVAQL